MGGEIVNKYTYIMRLSVIYMNNENIHQAYLYSMQQHIG